MSSLSASICVAIGLRSLSASSSTLAASASAFSCWLCQNRLQSKADLSESYRLLVQRERLLHALERTLRFEQPVVCFAHLFGNSGSLLGQFGRLELPFQVE